MKAPLALILVLGTFALVASGCGASKAAVTAPTTFVPTRVCAHPAGWRKLANRIDAAVYCPGWLPDPLTDQIGGQWNNINSVSPDRSYLESFVWQETGSGELHVNLRGYPGVTKIPTCRTGGTESENLPCFAQPKQWITENGIRARLYTVNQDADLWHLALLWRRDGTLYTLSEHVAPPLTYEHVVRYLKQELASLVLVRPLST